MMAKASSLASFSCHTRRRSDARLDCERRSSYSRSVRDGIRARARGLRVAAHRSAKARPPASRRARAKPSVVRSPGRRSADSDCHGRSARKSREGLQGKPSRRLVSNDLVWGLTASPAGKASGERSSRRAILFGRSLGCDCLASAALAAMLKGRVPRESRELLFTDRLTNGGTFA